MQRSFSDLEYTQKNAIRKSNEPLNVLHDWLPVVMMGTASRTPISRPMSRDQTNPGRRQPPV